jgi:predicted site-specific integrase-resolvase
MKTLTLEYGLRYIAQIDCTIMEALVLLGYARVSTDAQSLEAQMAALRVAGCEQVYAEKRSGAETDRKALAKLMKDAGPGDAVVVTPSIGSLAQHAIS